MDEILIEEKKYISSKQAAKITGYAKDYIGQLCREGRVPARLVGRSWYVLESAIQDHRFGNAVTTQEDVVDQRKFPSHAWEPPRYEAVQTPVLPSVRPKREEGDDDHHLQESWGEWFENTVQSVESADDGIEEDHRDVLNEKDKVRDADASGTYTSTDTAAVSVPLHTMSQFEVRKPLSKPLSAREHLSKIRSQYPRKRSGSVVYIAGMLLALAAIVLAIAGSGYLDTYMLSDSRASYISGVLLYDR